MADKITKSKRNKVDKIFKDKWQGQSIKLQIDGADIEVNITSKARKHFATRNKIESNRAFSVRLNTFIKEELNWFLDDMTYYKSAEEKKARQNKTHANTKRWHYFHKYVELNNHFYEVVLDVRENFDKNFTIYAVSFKSSDMEKFLDIKKSGLAIPASTADFSSKTTMNKIADEYNNVNTFDRFFSKNFNLYRIPYKDGELRTENVSEIDIDRHEIGWNLRNSISILKIDEWLDESFIRSQETDWIEKNYAQLNSITYGDTYERLWESCCSLLANKVVTSALVINGYSDTNFDDVYNIVYPYMFNNAGNKEYFKEKIDKVQVSYLYPYIKEWVDNLPDDNSQIWRHKLSAAAKEYYLERGLGRVSVSIENYITYKVENSDLRGRIKLNQETKGILKNLLMEKEERTVSRDIEKGVEL